VRSHPELRDQLWANVHRLRRGLRELGYAIGGTEAPVVPIFIRGEGRTNAPSPRPPTPGLYLNPIRPPRCPAGQVVLRASCSAAHTAEHLSRALDIFGRVGAALDATRVALS